MTAHLDTSMWMQSGWLAIAACQGLGTPVMLLKNEQRNTSLYSNTMRLELPSTQVLEWPHSL